MRYHHISYYIRRSGINAALDAMAKFKKLETYRILVDGIDVEVSEELYRVWLLHTNRERVRQRKFCKQVLKVGDEIQILPPQCTFVEDKFIDSFTARQDTEPDISMWRRAILAALDEAIRDLPGKLRAIILLSFYQEKTQSEIAEIIGIAQPTVYHNKKKALRLLRESMLSQGFTGEDVARYFINLE